MNKWIFIFFSLCLLVGYKTLTFFYMPPPKKCVSALSLTPQSGAEIVDYRRYKETVGGLCELNLEDPKSYTLLQSANYPRTQVSEEYVLVLDQARVSGRNGCIITKDNLLVKEASFRLKIRTQFMDKKWLPKRQKINETIVSLGQCSSTNYFHWMCDILPKLLLLQRSQIEYDKIYLPYRDLPFQKETLKLLNIDFDKVIVATNHTHIQAKKIIVPILCSYQGSGTDLDDHFFPTIRSFYEKFLGSIDSQERFRIYIGRKNTIPMSRFLINEEEVWPLMEQAGFKKYYLEDLTVLEQMKLFANAEAVIAYHGAGLTNLVFAPENTFVLELFHPQHYLDYYVKLSSFMKLNHYFSLTTPQKNSDSQKLSGTVDPSVISSFLEKLESEKKSPRAL